MREIQIEIFSFLYVFGLTRLVRMRTSNALRCGRAGHREQDPAYRRLDINYITAKTELVDLTTISHRCDLVPAP